jgi:hypothetical protein
MTNEAIKQMIELEIKKLPFVMWDRFHETKESVVAFGWIEREDNYKDFVVLFWDHPTEIDIFNTQWDFGFTTSSAKYSKEIAELLSIDGHADCQRIEDISEISNVIRLEDKNVN